MFTQTLVETERFSPMGYRASVEFNDEAVKENLCRALAAVNAATEAMAQLDTSDIEEVEEGVDDILRALKMVKREKTTIKRNDHRKTQYEDYMDIILKNTEVGGAYVMSHLMAELGEMVKHGGYREDFGYNADMFRTVMDRLVEVGTFKVTMVSTITVFTREK
jgi:hypothetical protein